MARKFALLDGMKIAYQEWGNSSNNRKILSLHGWLDNSNSFSLLGPYLAKLGFHVVAVDHIGHGRSSHLPLSATYSAQKNVSYAKQVVSSLNWKNYNIVGHSMGGIIGCLLASSFPEGVEKIVFIESFGPLPSPPGKSPNILRNAIESEIRASQRITHPDREKSLPKIYPSLSDAVNVRIGNTLNFSVKELSRFAAKSMVSR
jgi:pimeloyl-ACP methyl ester carboxylesterase